MKGKRILYRDQFGYTWFAKSIRNLREQIPGRVSKMYVDGMNGKTYHVGYVVGKHWCTAYTPMRKEA